MPCQHEHSADANAHFRPEATGTGPNHLQGQIATEPTGERRTSAHYGLPQPTPRDSAGARSRDLPIDRPHGMICVLNRDPAQDEKCQFSRAFDPEGRAALPTLMEAANDHRHDMSDQRRSHASPPGFTAVVSLL
jgi:hypothetical protein